MCYVDPENTYTPVLEEFFGGIFQQHWKFYLSTIPCLKKDLLIPPSQFKEKGMGSLATELLISLFWV